MRKRGLKIANDQANVFSLSSDGGEMRCEGVDRKSLIYITNELCGCAWKSDAIW